MTTLGDLAGDGAAGRALQAAISGSHSLEGWQEVLLIEACRCADRIAALDQAIAAAPDMPYDLIGEVRRQGQTKLQLIAAMRLPDGDGRRPQRRGPRGAYRPRLLP